MRILLIFAFVYLFSMDKVSVQLNSKFQFSSAGYITALEKGYYQDEGIDVKLYQYDNKSDIVKDVLNNKYQFGVYNENLIVDKLKGDDVKLISSFFKRSAVVIITQPNIKDIKQLNNKTIYIPKNLVDTISELFENNNVDIDSIHIVSNNKDLLNKFKNHKIDAKVGYIYDEVYLLDKNNIKFNIINPTDYDYIIYQGELFTNSDFANQNPILVDRFKKATIKGWYYALNHKKEIAKLIHNQYSNKSMDELLYEAKKMESIIGRYIYPIGYIDKESLKIQFEQEARELERTINVDKVVNDYVFSFSNPLDLDKEYLSFIKAYNYYIQHKLIIWLSILFIFIIFIFTYFFVRLKDEKQKIETLFDKVPVAYVIMDSNEQTVNRANQYALKLFKYPPLSYLNFLKQEIHVNEVSFYRFRELIYQYIDLNDTLEGFSENWTFKKINGEVIWVNIRALEYSENEILWIVVDIDELMKTQEKLDKQITATKKAMKVKEEFLANMSHEIRTPLNAILGFVDIIKKQEKNAENKKYLEIISKSGQSLLTIINDILDFSKIESGKLKVEKVEFNPKEEIENIVSLFESKAKEKNITIDVNFENLKYNIISDPIRIKQVISNLISNAIKFTPKGKKIYLNVSYNDKKEQLHCEVIDEGIGIESEKLSTIFEPFSQADTSTTRKYGGTGLGLTISKKLIRLLGGELSIESEKGKGSKFYFTIPAKKSIKLTEKKEEIKKDMKFEGRVLIVEDNEANQLFLKVILKNLGLSDIDIANDGLEAIEKVKTNQYDIILMDENMPNMNGLEATKKIKEMGIKTPVVAVTANALSGDKERFLKVMDEYLSKPIDKNELMKVLNKYLKEKND